MRNPPRLALFDLDGTLIDSQAGILGSLRHAFERIGVQLPEPEILRSWIGPPFHVTFPQVLGDDTERIETAIAHYREHYSATGWAQHELYPGMAEIIAELDALGSRVAIVTTKNETYARRIAAHLPYGARIAHVYATDSNTKHSAKAEMIAQALADFAVPANEAVMIGDRHFDIDGARANHVRGIGVAWGFGSEQELRDAGAHAIAHSPAELGEILLTAA
jgi:phosphoglycolate phosphatase